MFSKPKFNTWVLLVSLVFFPGFAYAGDLNLTSFVDETTDPINLPATNLLMATLNTLADKGGQSV